MKDDTDNPNKPHHPHDPVPRRILMVVSGVALSLLLFYAGLAIQAYAWSPAVYVRHTDGPRSRTLLDPSAPWQQVKATQLSPVERGREAYRRLGCATCHGLEGKGGVKNLNYQRGTFPQLNNISERLFLRDADSHAAALEALNAGVGLDEDDELDIERLRLVAAQYANVVHIISEGNPAQGKDPNGVAPLPMPAWKDQLTPTDIRNIIAYLVSLQDLKVYEEEEEE